MNAELHALTSLARAASAGTADAESVVGRLCGSIAETFGLEHLTAYRYVPERHEIVTFGDERPVASLAGRFAEALERREPVWEDGTLVVPLQAARPIGFLEASCEEPGGAERELLAACGAVTAGFLQRALERDELERLSDLEGQFIALASHELRAPAAVIHGIAKTVQARAGELPHDQLSSLHDALAAHTERLTLLIDELLDLSRLEAKAVPLCRERLPIRSRIEEIVRTVAGDGESAVSIDVPHELTALVDAGAFDRIVSNLVTNAIRYGSPPVQVRAVQLDRHLRVSVEDHGAGVAPGFVPKLFERFSRAPGDASRTGTGLGLSIARSYAHAHGGQLFYEDASPHGARFQLVLPSPHAVEA